MSIVLCEVFRDQVRESRHSGCLVAVDCRGPSLAVGEVEDVMYPRSALKPLQVLPLLVEGVHEELGLSRKQIALLSASHCGAPEHVRGVAGMLARAGIPVEALACGAHAPLDAEARRALERSGERSGALHNNCSGKHAGMLLLARHLGAPLEGYVSLDHPVQARVAETIQLFTGLPVASLRAGIDGCSAPAFRMPLTALARAMRRLADPEDLAPRWRTAVETLWQAVVAEPHFLAGRRILDQALVRAGDGRVLAKRGAEGVLVLAVRAARGQPALGIALKIDDGSTRGTYPVARWLADRLELPLQQLAEHLPEEAMNPLQNHRGVPVGHLDVGACLRTSSWRPER